MVNENLKRSQSMKGSRLLLLIVAICACRRFTDRTPTDEELLARFRAHKTELNQLVRMFQADKGLERVGESFTRPDDPSEANVPSQRIEEYRRLCASLGAPKCIEGIDAAFYQTLRDGGAPPNAPEVKNEIFVCVYGWGWAASGGAKGYLFSTAPTFEIVPALDHMLVTGKQSKTWIRHIEDAWYIYYTIVP